MARSNIWIYLDLDTYNEIHSYIVGSKRFSSGEDDLPTYKQLHDFLKIIVRAWENFEVKPDTKRVHDTSKSSSPRYNKNQALKAASGASYTASTPHENQKRPYKCPLCSEQHYVMFCLSYKTASVPERLRLIKQHRLCFNCLGFHLIADCQTRDGCRRCQEKDHTSIQVDNSTNADNASAQQNALPPPGDSLHSLVLLATAVVQVDTLQGKSLSTRILIDQGSELSFMKYSLFKKLRLTLHPDALTLRGIGNVSAGHLLEVGDVIIRSIHSSTSLTVVVHVLPSLTVDLPSFAITDPKWPHLQGLVLADPEFLHPRPVDIILGASPTSNIMCAEVIRGSLGTPISQSTTLRWIVYGTVNALSPITVAHSLHVSTDRSLRDAIAKFWEQEEIPSGYSTLNALDIDKCELHFHQTHYRNAEGRYAVRLPLKAPKSQLGDSLVTAISSLKRLTNRFAKDKEYVDLYHNFIDEYIQLGHMKRVSLNELPSNACFVPHNGVLKKDGITTKLRTLFNGSSPTSSGISLNDILHAGPKTQIDPWM